MNSILSCDTSLKLQIDDESKFLSKIQTDNHQIVTLPTQTHTIENVTSDNIPLESSNNIHNAKEKPNIKIFKIKKIIKFNKLLSEICSEEEISESDKNFKNPMVKKISPYSKVNFSKLKDEEKNDRLKNLAKLVKRLRRRVRNLEHKVKVNPSKLLNRYLWSKLGINTKNKYLRPEFELGFEKIVKALKKIKSYDEFEYNDEKHIIENLINLIANGDLKFDSLIYKKISSLIRLILPKEKVKYINKQQGKVTISFPETEVCISNKEYLKIAKFKDNYDALRAALGIENPSDRIVKIIKEEPKGIISPTQQINYPCISNFNNSNLLWLLSDNQYKNMLMNSFAFGFNGNINAGMNMNNTLNSDGIVNQYYSPNILNNIENKNSNIFLK